MNRLRSEPKTHPSVFIALFLAALVVMGGGITYAIYKNSQVKTARLIDQAEERIDQARAKIRMIEVNTDELLDRFDMRERLKESGSSLVQITPADIEEISPNQRTLQVVSVGDPP
jgi:maltodextrin utilization protein YvdJ